MTHFASAADYTSTQTDDQLAYFHAIGGRARSGPACSAPCLHTSSTNAIGYGRTEGWHTMVRAGHALYGYVSPARGDAPPQLLDVKPALTWKAKLLAVKDIPEGALVGYGGTFRAPRPMRIGILGRGLRRRNVSPPLEPRQGDRRRQAHAHSGHDLDGPDHHRPQPHHGARARRRSHAAGRGGRCAPGRAADRAQWPGPSPTTFFAASARACGGCTCSVAEVNRRCQNGHPIADKLASLALAMR